MSLIKFSVKYAIFAVVATLFNLTAQWFIFFVWIFDYQLYVALFLGTAVGLIVKYYLDKKWIFYYTSESKNEDLRMFGVYSLMGIITTFVFWGTEMLFFYTNFFENAQYVGGAIGLAFGYVVKYFLDKNFVFKVRG